MDSLLSAGKQYLANQQGGNNNNQSGNSGSGEFDISSIISHAQNHDSNGNGSSDLFSQAASFLQNSSNAQNGDIDENQVKQNGDKVNNSNDSAHSSEIGQAAALNAIKSFIGNNGSSSGGGSQQQLIGAAMSQAASLFDQKSSNGQVSGGDKQSAVNQAGEAVMKLMIKHQVASSGSLGSLASQFM